MKIFGKRKKKVASKEQAVPASKSDGDKAVEELLLLEETQLNSKQRRMLKRYHERKGKDEKKAESIDQQEPIDEEPTKSSKEEETPDPEENKTTEADTNKKSDNGSGNAINDEKKDSMDSAGAKDEVVESTRLDQYPEEETNDITLASEQQESLDKESVVALLETLNSKQRRKLMRQLERGGDEELQNVHQEALSLTKQKEEEKKIDKTKTATEKTASLEVKASKPSEGTKKRKGRDWSTLPPEERMRREEQRRLQQEAADRRAMGTESKHRHPLNSERRRANRRKPKWDRRSSAPPNEHHSSGYHMRKVQKTM